MQESSLQTRGRDFYGSLPLGTRGVFVMCVALYVTGVLLGFDDFAQICMAPSWVLRDGQVYRMFTSVLFHGSVLHLAFNMMAFVPMASSLERLLGTVQFTYILVLFTLLASIFHVGLAFIGGTLGYPSMHECAIGFSGVIFGVIVVDTHLSSVAQRSIFGFFTVPSQWYPLSLLIFLQVLMPSVSFVGHLSGLLAGLTYVRGHLNPLLLRPSTTAWIEQHAWAAPAVRHGAFIAGGAAADAVPGAGRPDSLPMHLFAPPRGGDGDGARRWWQVPTFARRPPPVEGTFATMDAPPSGGGGGGGAGATGAGAGPAKVPGPEPNYSTPAAAAAAAAAARVARTPHGAASRSSTRVMNDAGPMESMEVPVTAALTAATAAAVASEAVLSESVSSASPATDPDGLAALTEMGFPAGDARRALYDARGDVAAAVEILSSGVDDLR